MLPEVQKELKLTGDQKKQIQSAMMMAPQGGMPDPNSMSSMGADMDAKVLAPLTPDQLARLNELWVQYEGGRALRDKSVADKLQLTDDQKTKIASMWDAYQTTAMDQMQHLHPGSTMNGVKRLMKEDNDATFALLTPDQQKVLADMQGKPFKFKMPKQM